MVIYYCPEPGVQAGGCAGEEWRSEGRPGGHLHAHVASGHVHHAGLRPHRRSAQPHLRRLRLPRALRPRRPRQGALTGFDGSGQGGSEVTDFSNNAELAWLLPLFFESLGLRCCPDPPTSSRTSR